MFRKSKVASHITLSLAHRSERAHERLRILSLLARHEGEVCVCEIVEGFTLEQPTISHHLRILRDAGLVDCRKRGLWAYYYVKREKLSQAMEVIEGLTS